MKRVFMILALVMLISSCTHKEHSFSKEWIYDDVSHMRVCTSADCNETIAYAEHSFITVEGNEICNVCGYKIPSLSAPSEHTHTPADEYTSGVTQHWRECLTCGERVDISEHIFGDITVTVPPTSDSDGRGEKYCTVCGKSSHASIDRLPEKMSEDEWISCFSLSNVRIQEKSKNGSLVASDTVYAVDGNIVAEISSLGTAYYGRYVLSMIDFSEYYNSFSNYGEGVYKSSGFELVTLDGKMNIREVEIRIENSLLTYVSYSVNLGAFGTISYSYVLYDYGQVTLCPTYLNMEDVEAAIDVNNLSDGLTLSYSRYDASSKSTDILLTIQGESYVCKKYQDGIFKGVSSGEASLAAEGLTQHLSSIFKHFGNEDLIYEDFYDDYTYVGEGIDIPSFGLVVKFDIIMSDGRISSINVQLADGSTCHYDFSLA